MDFDELTSGEIEKQFKEMDKRPHRGAAEDFWMFFEALTEQGFSRREAMRILEKYAECVYDMSFSLKDKEEE